MSGSIVKNPYGLSADGKYTTIENLDPKTQYGLACNLVCPECGSRLIAVRSKGKKEFSHLAHYAKESTCQGYGESAAHKLAKEVLADAAISHEYFSLPDVLVSDSIPHDFHQSRDDKVLFKSINARIENVFFELEAANRFIEGNKIPDAIIELSYGEKTTCIAVEIYNTHAKSTEDVQSYAQESKLRGIIEIYVGDLQPDFNSANDFKQQLSERVLGFSDCKYWLYNPKAQERLSQYELCVLIDVNEHLYSHTEAIRNKLYSIVTSELKKESVSFHIVKNMLRDTSSIIDHDGYVHFDGYAFPSMPGYAQGWMTAFWIHPKELKNCNFLYQSPCPTSYGEASSPHIFKSCSIEHMRNLLYKIKTSSRNVIREKIQNQKHYFVPTDIIDNYTRSSITDELTYRQCPQKRLCMLRDPSPREWYALCDCEADCQFCLKSDSEYLMNLEETDFSIEYNVCAYPKISNNTPGFRYSLNSMVKSMQQAQYIGWYLDRY